MFPKWFNRSRTPVSKPTNGTDMGSKLSRNQDGEFYRLQDGTTFRPRNDDEVLLTNDVETGHARGNDSTEDGIPSYMGISVKRDIEWSESTAV
jgi:hypothetical protein